MAHDPAADDDLPPLIGPALPAQAAPRRPPRTWRLRRVTTLLLVLLLIVTGSLQELAADYTRSLVDDRVARESTDDRVTGSAATNRTEAFTYDELNRLIETSGAFVSESGYDAAGNRTSVAYGTGGVNGTDTFAYDWNNRLTAAEVDGVDVAYDYAGDDLRTGRTQGSSTAPYLWDRLTALPTMVGDGASQFVHGPGGVQNEVTGSTALRPLPDGLGSARVWTDASGASVGSADYDAWGTGQASTGTTGVFGWTGEPRDPTSNLVYLRARDYSPGTGRFAQRDTVQPNAAGTNGYNPYWYANDRPTTLTDPSGNVSAGMFESLTTMDVTVAGLLGVRAGVATYSAYSAIGLATTYGGIGSVALAVGAGVAVGFAVLVIVLYVILLLHELNRWCDAHGCALPGLDVGRVFGWIRTQTTAGNTEVALGIVGTATGACIAVLAFPGLWSSPTLANACNKGSNCLQEAFEDPVEALLSEALGSDIKLPNAYQTPVFGFSASGPGAAPKRCDPTPCRDGGDDTAKGGVYRLMDGSTVMYVGRTNDFKRREREHGAHPVKGLYLFVPFYRTDSLATQIGPEQILYDRYHPPLNRRRPISPFNPWRGMFMNMGHQYEQCRG